ncbi:MAG: peptidylprolyl isomerase [Oligoflexia bacterium]|nr:peptidylprolyl isomerase [Oligoflexia bacterium]
MRKSILTSLLLASLPLITPGLIRTAKAADPAPATGAAKAPAPEASGIAAVFNGKEIKISDLDAEIQRKPAFAMWQQVGSEDPVLLNRVRLAALNGMINRELLLATAKQSGVINEKDIQGSVDQTVQGYGGKDKLTPLLSSIGTNYEQFTSEIADDFRINAYIEKSLAKDVKVSEQDAKKAFDSESAKYTQGERIHVSHILIRLDPSASAQEDKAAQDKINELYKKASAPNADFGAIAKESSQCPSAPQGGDLGVVDKGKTVPAFEQAAFSLKPGEVSKPVRTQFGYHIIKVSEKFAAEKPDFTKSRALVEKDLLQKKKTELVEAKVNELRASAQIKIMLQAS